MSANYRIVAENPNAVTGPGGCLCDDLGTKDTKGPFAVFFTTEMESNLAPTPVVCAHCIRCLADDLEDFEGDEVAQI